jgi:hypothetical protein
MGRPSPERRSRSTSDKSPVRKSRTPGSVGEVLGNQHLYPTVKSGHNAADGAVRMRLVISPTTPRLALPAILL